MKVVAEHYCADGSIHTLRTTMRKWKTAYAAMPKRAGEFVVLWWKHQKRWDGSRRKELHSTCCEVGFRVEWIDTQANGKTQVVPVLVVDDQ